MLGKDPVEVMEEVETRLLVEVAEGIFKLPEPLWESKIALQPADRRDDLRRCLTIMKEHRPLRVIRGREGP